LTAILCDDPAFDLARESNFQVALVSGKRAQDNAGSFAVSFMPEFAIVLGRGLPDQLRRCRCWTRF